MASLATIHKKRSIIMAANSLVPPDTLNANLQKLFFVSSLKVGISTLVRGAESEKSMGDILHDFSRSTDLGVTDCHAVAAALVSYLQDHHAEMETAFNLCGFDGNTPVVVEIERSGTGRWQTRHVNRCEQGTIVESIWAPGDKVGLQGTAALPDFGGMSTVEAIAFLERFFVRQPSGCPAARRGTVDILVLTPERNFFVKAKDLSVAVI